MQIQLQALRFVFAAPAGIYFPEGKAANILRGAFGTIFRQLACVPECQSAASCAMRSTCPYARMFEPRSEGAGPSGLSDWPRPFVFRASHLDGIEIKPAQNFHFDMNLFDLKTSALAYLILTFNQLAREGLGAGRKPVELLRVESLDADGSIANAVSSEVDAKTISVPLSDPAGSETCLTVRFVTPTELKSDSHLIARPEFAILAARIRDRVATLCQLYGDGLLDMDFRGFGERAARVRMTRCDVRTVDIERRSSRTGQVHHIGGFVGEAEYEGELAEFIPWLQAAYWTGAGRQTAWGKGMIEIISAS